MRIAELDPAWLTKALHEGGFPDAQVEDLSVAAVGTGQMAESYRITPSYAAQGGAPATVVAKLSPADTTSRETSKAQSSYLREVNFYRFLASTAKGRTPACLYTEIDDEGGEFALLMEDVGPARAGDQLAGCSVAECAAAIDEISLIHGARWGDPELETLPWMNIGAAFYPMATAWLQSGWGTFKERYRDVLDGRAADVGAALIPNIDVFFANQARMPGTIQHGDFRPDNILFDIHGGGEPAAIVDWQTVMLGPGVLDVAYFVGGALSGEDRQANEERLFDRYYDSLAAQGIRYPKAQLWDDYRACVFWLYLVAMGASVNVARTDRGDEMFMSMIDHATRQIIDLDALTTLG